MPYDEHGERNERDTVVPLELFFDLVFVFAFTQVTTLLTRDATRRKTGLKILNVLLKIKPRHKQHSRAPLPTC